MQELHRPPLPGPALHSACVGLLAASSCTWIDGSRRSARGCALISLFEFNGGTSRGGWWCERVCSAEWQWLWLRCILVLISSVVASTLHVAGKGPAYVLGRQLPQCCFRSCLASGIPLTPVVFCAGRARCRWWGMEFLLRTLAVGIVLTEYFPAVDDGVVTVGPALPSRSVRIARALRFPSSVMCCSMGKGVLYHFMGRCMWMRPPPRARSAPRSRAQQVRVYARRAADRRTSAERLLHAYGYRRAQWYRWDVPYM